MNVGNAARSLSITICHHFGGKTYNLRLQLFHLALLFSLTFLEITYKIKNCALLHIDKILMTVLNQTKKKTLASLIFMPLKLSLVILLLFCVELRTKKNHL